MDFNKSPLSKLLLLRFHESALWGAIKLVRNFAPNISTREIIREYRKELDISDDSISESTGWAMFCRIDTKVNRARNEIANSKHTFKSELLDEVKDLNERIDNLIKALEK